MVRILHGQIWGLSRGLFCNQVTLYYNFSSSPQQGLGLGVIVCVMSLFCVTNCAACGCFQSCTVMQPSALYLQADVISCPLNFTAA